MIPRRVLLGGGLAAFASRAVAQERVEIAMRGSARGERVWFSPQGLAVAPGTTLRFVNRDLDNSHIDAGDLVAEVVAVRGWPPKARSAGNAANAAGQRYFPGEDRSVLPASNQALRTLRAACS